MQQRREQRVSATVVATEVTSQTFSGIPVEGILNLSPAGTSQTTITAPVSNRVTFHESIVDNENLGRKKSKICCIYRKPYDPNDSSSDETTSEEEGNEEGTKRIARNEASIGNSYDVQPKRKNKHKHKHCSH